FGKPVMLAVVVGTLVTVMAVVNEFASVVIATVALAVAVLGTIALGFGSKKEGAKSWHGILEGRGLLFSVLTVLAVLVGGVAEILPSVAIGVHDRATTQQQPYTALELEGRDVYVAEGCY